MNVAPWWRSSGDEADDDCEMLHLTGLQADKGVFRDSFEALADFVSDHRGWHRHTNGHIVIHETACIFGDDPADRCSCDPMLVFQRQSGLTQ